MSEQLTRELLQRFAPSHSREVIAALFTVEREILASAADTLDHAVAHARLAWWREELDLLTRGRARHPAVKILATAAQARALSGLDLRGLLDHAEVDLSRAAFLTREQLDTYLRQWALALFRTLVQLSAPPPEDPLRDFKLDALEPFALRLGTAIREIERLAAFTTHARGGRIYWPLGDPPQDHRVWTMRPLEPEQSQSLAARLDLLDQELCAAAALLPAPARAAQSVSLVYAALCRRQGIALRHALPQQPAQRRSEPIRRTIRAWAAAVAAGRGHVPRALRPASRSALTSSIHG
jgi:phytoene synthase